MTHLLNAIQAALNTALSGNVVDVTEILSAADSLSEGDAEALRTSIANPKELTTHLADAVTMLKNGHALYTARSLNSAN